MLKHSGQEVFDEIDFNLPGRDASVEIELIRRHQSGFGVRDLFASYVGDDLYFPMYGPAWSTNYQRSLWRFDDGEGFTGSDTDLELYEIAFGRIDTFRRVLRSNSPAGSTVESDYVSKVWDGTRENTAKVVWDEDGGAAPRVWYANGVELRYSAFEDAGGGRSVARLESIVSPNGNLLQLHYGSAATVDEAEWHQVERIVDSYGRTALSFDYTSAGPGGKRLVESVRDFDGRAVTYQYEDQDGQVSANSDLLVAATFPLTGQHSDYAPIRSYEYSHRASSSSRLKHNLTAVVDANQNAPGGTGLPYVSFTYYEDGLHVGRIRAHATGNLETGDDLLDAGGTTLFTYEYNPAALSQGGTPDPTLATLFVTMLDAKGTQVRYGMNYMGSMLSEVFETSHLRPGTASLSERNFVYGENAEMKSSVGAEQSFVTAEYAEQSYPDGQRAAAHLPIRMTREAGPRGADQPVITREVIYEPVFHRPFQIKSPNGEVTTFIYDYMEDVDANLAVLTQCLGFDGDPEWYSVPGDAASVPILRYQFDLMLARAFVDVSSLLDTDVNGDGDKTQLCGNIVLTLLPAVDMTVLGGAPLGGGTQAASMVYTYNDYGQLQSYRDPEENYHTRTYYDASIIAGHPFDGSGNPIGNGSGSGGGYLRSITYDAIQGAASSATRNSGVNTTPADVTHHFGYSSYSGDFVGSGTGQTSYTRARPTVIYDGRGVSTKITYDSHDQRTRVIRAASSLTGTPSVSGLTRAEQYYFDPNGNLQAAEFDSDIALSGRVRNEYDYDILNQVREERLDVGSIGMVTQYRYDKKLNLAWMRRVSSAAPSDPEVSPITTWEYDERNIVIRERRAVGTALEVQEIFDIDKNGNMARWTDASGDTTTFEYDGHDRLIERKAPDGTRHQFKYDAMGNNVEFSVRGSVKRLTGAVTAEDCANQSVLEFSDMLLFRTRRSFDERNRQFLVRYLNEPILSQLPSDNGDFARQLVAQGVAASDEIALARIYDRQGRVVASIDAEGNKYTAQFDGLDRHVKVSPPEPFASNARTLRYDKGGNLIELEYAALQADGNLVGAQRFRYTFEYDALGQLVSDSAPNGQIVRYGYDKQGNQTRRVDPLGAAFEWDYDGLGRVTGVREFPGGQSPTGMSSVIEASAEWDSLGRLKALTDGKGNQTYYHYNAREQVASIRFPDGTVEAYEFNGDGDLLEIRGQAGDRHRFCLDETGRRTVASHFAPLPLSQELEIGDANEAHVQAWAYDGMGRVWSDFDSNGPGEYNDVANNYSLDTIGRRRSQEQSVGGGVALTNFAFYQGDERLRAQVYPSGRRLLRGYDELDRLTSIDDLSSNDRILERGYVGLTRLWSSSLGNGARLDREWGGSSFDDNGRLLSHEWRRLPYSAADSIVSYQTSYDGPNGVGTNRRVTEMRGHLGGRQDEYFFDQSYRAIGFVNATVALDTSGQSVPVTFASSRSFDSADGLESLLVHEVVSGGAGLNPGPVDLKPAVDSEPSEEGLNQLTEFLGRSRIFDQLGGLQQTSSYGESLSLRFDTTTRLIRVTGQGAGDGHFEYVYDARNRRVAKFLVSSSGAAPALYRRYSYDMSAGVIEEYGANGVLDTQFVEGDTVDDHIELRTRDDSDSSWVSLFYHKDFSGSTGALSDEDQVVVEYMEYDWFGSPKFLGQDGLFADSDLGSAGVQPHSESSCGNPYLFHGRRYDVESGLYYYRNRYYDPLSGVFVSVDPSGVWTHGQGNGYSAFDCDPFNWRDPYGLDFLDDVCDVAVGTVAATSGFANEALYGLPEMMGDYIHGEDSPGWKRYKESVGWKVGEVVAQVDPRNGLKNLTKTSLRRGRMLLKRGVTADNWRALTKRVKDGLAELADHGRAVARAQASKIKRGRTPKTLARKGDDGRFLPDGRKVKNGHLAGKQHPKTGVEFDKDGFPMFPHVGKSVDSPCFGDIAKERKALMEANGWDKWPEGMDLHHHQNGRTVMAVPHEIHSKTGHTGGIAIHVKE